MYYNLMQILEYVGSSILLFWQRLTAVINKLY